MKKLKYKIAIVFTLISLLLFIASGLAVSHFSQNAIVEISEVLSNEIVKSNADTIAEYIAARTSELKHITQHSALKEMNLEESLDYLKRIVNNSEYESLALVAPDGQAWATTGATLDLSKSPYMKEIFQNGAYTFVSDPFLALSSGNIIVSIAEAIVDYNGNKVGVISAALPLSKITEISEGINIEEKGFGWIVNQNGLIIAHRDAEVAMLESIDSDNEGTYKAVAKHRDDILENPHGFKEVKINGEDTYLFYSAIENSLNWKLIVEIPKSVLLSSINSLNRIFLMLILVVSASMILAAFIVSNIITKPIAQITKYSEKVAKLDFSEELPGELINRKDEIGALSLSFSNILNSLRGFIQDISGNSNYISSSSQQLSLISSQSAVAAEEVARTIEEIAKGATDQARDTENGVLFVTELGEIIEKDLQFMKDLNNSTNEVLRLKEEGLETLQDLVHKTELNNKASREVQDTIVNTRKSAEKIEAASQMIKSIADQTNLLALNAAIEAARAGEAGRGFAVVADEIRKLAEQSNDFTEEIVTIIKELTTKTAEAVMTMDGVGKLVDSQSASVITTNEKFDGISNAIENTKRIIEELNQSGITMENKKNEIINIIQNLSAISEENAAGTQQASASVEEQTASMEEISNASEALAKLAEDMQESIAKFKL